MSLIKRALRTIQNQKIIPINTAQVHGASNTHFVLSNVSTASGLNNYYSAVAGGLEFEAESSALVVGVRAADGGALQLDDALADRRGHVDAQSLEVAGAVLAPRRQRRRLVRRDDRRRRRRLGQLVVGQVRRAAVDNRLEQLPARLGARQHVVTGADATKELGVGRPRNVRHLEVESLLRLRRRPGRRRRTTAGSRFRCWRRRLQSRLSN